MPKRAAAASSDAILEAARSLLHTEGTAALSVRRIAATAGGSTMNVYSRFGGKDGVVDALFVEGFELLAVSMRRVRSTADPLADLLRCASAYRTFALANRSFYELMFERSVPEFEPSEHAMASAIATLGLLADRLQRAMDAGVLRVEDPLTTATVFWSACHGPVSLELKGIGPKVSNWAEVHRRLIAGLIDGMRPIAA